MSDKPEIELDLDLQLLPAWARQPQATNRYAEFEESGDRDRRGPRGRPGGGGGGPRRDFRGGRPDGRGPRPDGGPSRGPRSGGDRGGGDFRGRGGDRRDRGGGPRYDGPRREPVEEMPEGITVDLIPEPSGVESLTKQIRQTGRAYPLFDIGHLILKRPDRYLLEFKTTGNLADGTPRQLFSCSLDDSIWMSEGEAVRHVLTRHFDTFYQTEKIAVEPPKGTYTFVARCGMSGVILGPPNLHEYQAKLQRLHAERFSRMPFEMFKSRVQIVRDEAVVKQWLEEQSFKFEYTALNLPEPVKLASREAVEEHFRQVHLPNIIRGVSSHTVRTPAARETLPGPLRRLARREFDLQQRFPLKLVTRLSDDFAHRGLHFFKVNKTVLHVAVARPRYLDLEANPVTDGVKRILQTIESTPGCTRRKLLEAMGVSLPATPEAPAPAAAPAAAPAPEATPAEGSATEGSGTEAAPAPATPAAAPVATSAAPSPELQTVISDLHWLVHEGHVIEFANGMLEAAKKPVPRPQPAPRPPRAPAVPATPAVPTEETPATAGATTGETVEGATADGSTPETQPTAAGSEGGAAESGDAGTPEPVVSEVPVAEASASTDAGASEAPAGGSTEPAGDEARINPS